MMSRIVFLVLALFVVWRVLSSLGKRAAAAGHGADSYSRFSPRKRRHRLDERSEAVDRGPQVLVPCSGCGTFVPGGRVVKNDDGRVFCSESCLEGKKARGSNER